MADERAGRRRGLGMGLSALLGGDERDLAADDRSVRRVPVEFLRPSPLQPRRRFEESELAALAASLRDKGVLQPLLVRPTRDPAEGYEIVAGERRWRAAQIAGLDELPVIVRDLDDAATLELALVENVQRADLNAVEEAQALRRLADEFGHTQEALARLVGKSRSHVANTLRLLSLPAVVLDLVISGRLSAGHARALLTVRNPEHLVRQVIDEALSVRETEALAKRRAAAPPPRPRPTRDVDVVDLERKLSEALGLEVGIRPRGRGGLVTIRWHDYGQLDGLLGRLR